MGTREGMVKAAEGSLGTKGRPNVITIEYAERNGGEFARAAWCGMGITYWSRHSGNFVAVNFGTDFAWVISHAQRFKNAGKWTADVSGIARGDIVFFDWQGSDSIGAIDHVGLVTDVQGSKVFTIEANTTDACLRRVRDRVTIAGYGRPAYDEEPAAPAPPPVKKPAPAPQPQPVKEPTEYTAPPFPAGLRPGSKSPSAKGLQRALKAGGYMAKSVPEADNYGPKTEDGVAKFYKANKSLSSGGRDTKIGPKGWAELHREAYGDTKPAPPPPGSAADGEPAHNYDRVTYGGRTVNERTKAMLSAAAGIFGKPFTLSQGSYNTGVSASAGTHDGGGVVDVSVSGMSPTERDTAVKALRKVGFAAWLRTPAEGFSYHIHACAIGDREMSPSARSQVRQYFDGKNGLRGRGPDTATAGRPIPAWAEQYRT